METQIFSADAKGIWNEDERGEFCGWITENPLAGDVIPGTGGCRKVRWSRAGMGKRGGVRVIYFDRLENGVILGTIPGYPAIHNAAYLTDGNYGNGRSWIGADANSWLTIDLGSIQTFDTLSFGRDRLGGFTDRTPGQFTISISNDNALFTQIFDSAPFGFS